MSTELIPIARAVEIASTHLRSLITSAQEMSLEEAEISDDDQNWLITLGYFDAKETAFASGLVQALGHKPRKYKIFTIRRATGEVRSMKMREPERV